MNQQKPKKQVKMETTRSYGETRRWICQNGWQNSRRILRTKVFQPIGTHQRVLLVNQLQWYRASTVFILTSRRTEIADICMRTEITRAPCRRRIGGAVPRAENFSDLITADHKVLSEGCESRKKSSICNHGARLGPPNGSSRIRVKQKLLRKPNGACKSSWNPRGNL